MKNKIYFASDFHLGAPDKFRSKQRELLLVNWLDMIKNDATELYLLGDVFDFWYEWKYVVPKGFVRFLCKLSELVECGIKVYYFTGNHDIWAYRYLSEEIGLIIVRKPITIVRDEKKLYLAHGDGLGPKDYGFKIMKMLFTNNILQFLFSRLHPNFSIWLGTNWSLSRDGFSRTPTFTGEKEWLIQHSEKVLKNEHFDYFIYGHRHIPGTYSLSDSSIYVNLGDWLVNNTYAEFEGGQITLKKFNIA